MAFRKIPTIAARARPEIVIGPMLTPPCSLYCTPIDMTRIRLATNFLNDEESMFVSGNQKLAEENNFYVITGTQSIKTIRAKQNKEKYDVIIIDYMQLIMSAGNRGGNRASEVGDISRGLKAIATDFGIPVIATTGGGTNEIVIDGYNGYLISPKDEDELYKKTLDLLNNEHLRVEISNNAKKHIIDNFTLERSTKQYIELYKSVLKIV